MKTSILTITVASTPNVRHLSSHVKMCSPVLWRRPLFQLKFTNAIGGSFDASNFFYALITQL